MKDILKGFFELHFKRQVEVSYYYIRDLTLLSIFLDYFGLDNPLGIYALDLYPYMLEEFHLWHRSLGMERGGLDFLPCC
ncbi:MAG: hypothetical protein N2648_00965 [Aquificaceae bacterium]|nr:hypothetical protein [Aquificaceae bacterium]MCS7196836.1 hypothetical protein [Aquificaceae bacterium]MCX7989199.1 hypothetical protein [Aquificaceae bacterium]MDW8032951.1 hypothetical protein [Aquificaceae bacterium]MDW8293909.1 hypothetical protein [Aquificaceae bacterium]